jgi:hypothetical protein
MDADKILEGQAIVLKRGRMNSYGYEPAWNSYFDFYISPRYIKPSLLKLEDMSLHLYLRKNINDKNPSWKMPTIKQMRVKLGVSYDRLYAMLGRLEKAHLLLKESGVRKGEGGENIRNTYILSDPIQTLEEFLTVAREGLFGAQLSQEWCSGSVDPYSENRNTPFRNLEDPPIPDSGGDQQTLTTEQEVWENVLLQLKESLPATSFTTFLDGTKLLAIENGVVTIQTAKPYSIDWLKNRMGSKLPRMIEAELRMLKDPRTVSALQFEFL